MHSSVGRRKTPNISTEEKVNEAFYRYFVQPYSQTELEAL
jgi:hypothetical protein